MLSKIKVYGRLARFLGERSFEAEITTPLHAFKFLLANFPHLERHMMEQNYCIKVGKDEIDETELFNPIGQQEIKIVPVATGSRGITRVLAGVALIGLTVATGGFGTTAGFSGLGFSASAGAAAGAKITLGAGLAAAAGNLGIYLALSGAAQMLTPVPQPPGVSEDPQSQNFSFSGVQNTSRAGTAIPVIYGEIFAGSLVVSAGIDTVQIKGTA
jgi:predicted phage tail protein|tara:strand:- start:4013 stop:4654 length:642 start_codon:yes stop_codon:yes gene_type:complete